MKIQEFKKIIKAAVREAIQEELKDILLEAIKPSSGIIQEQKKAVQVTPATPVFTSSEGSQADVINGLLLETARSGNWRGALNMSTQDLPTDTFTGAGESNVLPGGEVPLDLILKMTNGGRS